MDSEDEVAAGIGAADLVDTVDWAGVAATGEGAGVASGVELEAEFSGVCATGSGGSERSGRGRLQPMDWEMRLRSSRSDWSSRK